MLQFFIAKYPLLFVNSIFIQPSGKKHYHSHYYYYYYYYYCYSRIIIFRVNKTAYSIIAREQAPSGATEDMFVPESVSSTVGKSPVNFFLHICLGKPMHYSRIPPASNDINHASAAKYIIHLITGMIT